MSENSELGVDVDSRAPAKDSNGSRTQAESFDEKSKDTTSQNGNDQNQNGDSDDINVKSKAQPVVEIDDSELDDDEKPGAGNPDEDEDLNPPTLDPTEDDEDKWNDNYQFVEDDKPGIEPNEKDPKKLILWAAQNNELDTLRDLLEKDPTLVDARDEDLYTPLHRAAYSNNVEVIKILLSYDADIGAKTGDGWQPLHSACKWDSVEAASLLIQNGADVNAQTNGHVTPLHLAAANAAGRRTLELLLWHPYIDPNIQNDAHDTAYDIACRSGPLGSLFEMLEESVNVY